MDNKLDEKSQFKMIQTDFRQSLGALKDDHAEWREYDEFYLSKHWSMQRASWIPDPVVKVDPDQSFETEIYERPSVDQAKNRVMLYEYWYKEKGTMGSIPIKGIASNLHTSIKNVCLCKCLVLRYDLNWPKENIMIGERTNEEPTE
ncbi:MAG: hypothetical protein ACQEXQ_03555 [Bacillota bacterium]